MEEMLWYKATLKWLEDEEQIDNALSVYQHQDLINYLLDEKRILGNGDIIMNKLTKVREMYIEARLEEAALLRETVEETIKSYTDKSKIHKINKNKLLNEKQFDNWIYFEGNFEKKNECYDFIVTFQIIDQDLNSNNIHIIDNRVGLMVRKVEKDKNYKWGLKEWLKAPTMYELPLNNIDREAIAKLIVSDKHIIDEENNYFDNKQKSFNTIKNEYFIERNKLFKDAHTKLVEEISKSAHVEGDVGRIAYGFHSYKGGAKDDIKYGLALRPYNLGSWRYFEGNIKYKDEEWSFIITLNVIKTNLNDVFGDTEKLGIMVDRNNAKKDNYNLSDWKKSLTDLNLEEANGTNLLQVLLDEIDDNK